jgi:hypothetical protein
MSDSNNVKIEVRLISDKELTEKYGGYLRYNIGDCFKTNDNHYYMQRSENVLHIKDGELINILHNSALDKEKLIKISDEEFADQLKTTIFNLGIYAYTENKE